MHGEKDSDRTFSSYKIDQRIVHSSPVCPHSTREITRLFVPLTIRTIVQC